MTSVMKAEKIKPKNTKQFTEQEKKELLIAAKAGKGSCARNALQPTRPFQSVAGSCRIFLNYDAIGFALSHARKSKSVDKETANQPKPIAQYQRIDAGCGHSSFHSILSSGQANRLVTSNPLCPIS